MAAGEDLILLCSLTLRGKRYRFGTETITITNATDETQPEQLLYRAALTPVEYEDAISIGGDLAPDKSVSVTLLFSDDDGDQWSDIVAGDHDLGDGFAELAMIRAGDPWDQRRILLVGRVGSPTYGAHYEPVQFNIAEDPTTDTGALPPSAHTVNDDTWPRAAFVGNVTYLPTDNAYQQLYPRVYGAPGIIYAEDSFEVLPAVPALVVALDSVNATATTREDATNNNSVTDGSCEPATLLLFGHAGSVSNSGNVTVYNRTEDGDLDLPKQVSGWSPTAGQDERGTIITELSVFHSSSTGLRIDADHEVYYSFQTATKGGVWNADRSACMRNAAEIILDLLQLSTLRFDRDRVAALAGQLGGFDLDFFINEQRTPYEIIQDEILPLLPISPVIGPNGLYFAFWNFTAETADAVDTIDPAKRGGYRNSPVQVSDVSSVWNQATMEFALRADNGEYMRSLTVAPHEVAVDGDTWVHPAAYASGTRYTPAGMMMTPRVSETITSDIVYDPATARAVLDWQLRANCAVHEVVEYILPRRYAALDPGSIVVVTDSTIGWTDKICIITSITRGIDDVLVLVRSLPYWVRDAI
jgi:hypothetical protein